jgi:hypothetical protein
MDRKEMETWLEYAVRTEVLRPVSATMEFEAVVSARRRREVCAAVATLADGAAGRAILRILSTS